MSLRIAAFCEVGSLIVFAGTLAGRGDLQRFGDEAVEDLRRAGYRLDSSLDAIRIYPFSPSSVPDDQAGGWRPGVIALRPSPASGEILRQSLRHELMHEARFRFCHEGGRGTEAQSGRTPWIEEGAALAFSGEARATTGEPASADLRALRRAVETGRRLVGRDYDTLRMLVARYGWPDGPCADPPEAIARAVGHRGSWQRQGMSYLVLSMVSGRVLERSGAMRSPAAVGSLMKIAYVAALRSGEPFELGAELARSDTAALLKRLPTLDRERYIALLRLGVPVDNKEVAMLEQEWPAALLGERKPDGEFLAVQGLEEFGRVVRAAVLSRPEPFRELWRNGFVEGSTLRKSSPRVRELLRKLHASAKTGTVATASNAPVIGHLAVIWPRESPVYLALFRAGETAGAGVAERAAPLLERFLRRFPPGSGMVRMKVLTRLRRADFEIHSPCPALTTDPFQTECGVFSVVTKVKSARSERFFAGMLEPGPDGAGVVVTDPESYADQVLEAEADDSRGEARRALRAVVVWNALHARERHRSWNGLCDTTHCMVNLGSARPPAAVESQTASDETLLAVLDRLAARRREPWFAFSRGGEEPWREVRSADSLRAGVGGESVISLERDRRPDGTVVVRLTYDGTAEEVPCALFQARLHLPSCPARIAPEHGGGWSFEGRGAGHGEGLSVERAQGQSESGLSAKEILLSAYAVKDGAN